MGILEHFTLFNIVFQISIMANEKLYGKLSFCKHTNHQVLIMLSSETIYIKILISKKSEKKNVYEEKIHPIISGCLFVLFLRGSLFWCHYFLFFIHLFCISSLKAIYLSGKFMD